MKYLSVFTSCLAALALHSAAWAEIYETKDAEGNTVYTDSPVNAGSEVVDLTQTNISDAPPPEPKKAQQPAARPVGQTPPITENEPVVIQDADPEEELREGDLRRQREYERNNPDAPHKVLEADSPHEVLEAEPRHEVGDFHPAPGADRGR